MQIDQIEVPKQELLKAKEFGASELDRINRECHNNPFAFQVQLSELYAALYELGYKSGHTQKSLEKITSG
jgi:hypothetical protein